MLFFNLTLKPLAPLGCTKPVVTGLLDFLHEAEHGSTWFGAIQVPKPSVPLFCVAELNRAGSHGVLLLEYESKHNSLTILSINVKC